MTAVFDPGGISEWPYLDPGSWYDPWYTEGIAVPQISPADLWMPVDTLSGYAGDLSGVMVYDSQTGFTIPLSEAIRLDPVAAQEIMTELGLGETGPTQIPSDVDIRGNVRTEGWDLRSPQGSGWLDALGDNKLAAILGLGTLGLGAAGIGQALFGGDRSSTSTVQREVPPASGTETQAYQQAAQGAQDLYRYLFGGADGAAGSTTGGGGAATGGVSGRLAARQPFEEAAYLQSILGMQQNALTAQVLGAGLAPALATGALGLTGGQDVLAAGLLPSTYALMNTAARAGQGNLPLTPELARMVEEAFTPQLGDVATRAIESARQRGFAGGADLLGQAPGAIAGPALSDIQGQIAREKLNLALALPKLQSDLVGQAGNVMGQYSTPAAVRLSGLNNLGLLNQNMLSTLGSYGQQGVTSQLGVADALARMVGAQTGIGSSLGQQRQGGTGQTTTTAQPTQLLDAFAPTASLLGGLGGLMYGLSGVSPSLSGR